MVKEFHCAMKGDYPQIRREGREATAYDLYRTMKISMFAQSLDCSKVKVPIV